MSYISFYLMMLLLDAELKRPHFQNHHHPPMNSGRVYLV